MKTLYDVCNDYSLDINVSNESKMAAESNKYKWINKEINGIKVKLGVHKQYGEVHYLKSENSSLNGIYI